MTTRMRGIIRGILVCFSISAVAASVFLGVAAAQEKGKEPAFRNPSLPMERRVDDLVSRMTLEEKVLQMQYIAPAIPRLGIPSYNWWNEALHGVARSGHATVFPQAIGMAATWDAPLIHREAEVIATETRAKYNQAQREGNHNIYYGLTHFSPNINIYRDPRWGRGQETYGEDPFLTGKMGVAFVTGLQGKDRTYLEAVATSKHYAVHSGPETKRHGVNIVISPHDLEDTYLPAFRATVTEGQVDSVMCAYNAIDGEPACANTYLLAKTLREAWNFKGYVVSDCGAVSDITRGHHFAADDEHGSTLAVRAGMDLTCGDEYATLVKAVKDGLIKEEEIDASLKRVLTARLRLGMFDPPDAVPFNRIPFSQSASPAHRLLSREVARKSIVLLKNQNGLLPVKGSKKIAVVGPNAELLVALEGNYNGIPIDPVYPVDGMRKVFAGKAEILYAQGSAHVAQVPVPVPRYVFHPAGKPSVAGLKAEYFPAAAFSGKPALVRVDPQIQFDWNSASPAPGIPMKTFAVRWTGTLTAPGTGDYSFSVGSPAGGHDQSQDTLRVYLDGKLVAEAAYQGNKGRHKQVSFQTHFADVRPHSFRMEYTHDSPLQGAGAVLSWSPPVEVLRDEAVKVARQADLVVVFAGLSPDLEGEEMRMQVEGFYGGDRTDIGLPRVQQDLLEALAATGKPLVLVLMNGGALGVNWAEQHAGAILEAWYPGEEGGTAIAETLAGINNPAGRLPVTFYTSVDQLPPFEDYSMQNRTYRYFKGEPLYPFGYGLSYAAFAYSNLKLSSSELRAGEALTAEVNVRNTAKIGGDEVVQLYIEYPESPTAPLRALKGFARVHLAPGASQHVVFKLTPRDLSQVTEKGEHRVLPGRYSVCVGGGQPLEGVKGMKAALQISGEQLLPR